MAKAATVAAPMYETEVIRPSGGHFWCAFCNVNVAPVSFWAADRQLADQRKWPKCHKCKAATYFLPSEQMKKVYAARWARKERDPQRNGGAP